MGKLRLGIVGLKAGQWHLETLSEMRDVEIVAMAENNPQGPLAELSRQYQAKPFESGVEMLKKADLDAVILSVSPKHRLELMEMAIENNIAMLIEPPFATDEEHAKKLVKVLEKSKAPIFFDFILRFFPAVQRLRHLIETDLGEGILLSSHLVLPWQKEERPWVWDPQNGNGIINENTCHLFDLICFLMGDPVSLFSVGGSYLGTPLEDAVSIMLTFKNGSTASLVGGSVGSRGLGTPMHLMVCMKKGQAIVTGQGHMYETLTWAEHGGTISKAESWELPPRRQIMQYSIRHFLDCLQNGRKPEIGLKEALRTQAIFNAFRKSMQQKQPIAISL